MRTRIAVLGPLVAGLLAVSAAPAAAISYGEKDHNRHPEVGALLAEKAYSDGTYAYCSGTLVSPTVLVTAAHCGDPGQRTARVTFVPHYKPGAPVYVGRYVADPAYTQRQNDPHDLAVVVFDSAIPGITPARLPTAGLLDRLRDSGHLRDATFTAVGYGSLAPTNGPGGKNYVYSDTRYLAFGSFNSLNQAWLRLSGNPATGDGGTCFGDSGGPNFLGGPQSDLLVATTITGDAVCRATNVDYRLDTASARSFLARFVRLP